MDYKNKYDGNHGKLSKFRKLIRKRFENVCAMDPFKIAIHWNESGSPPRITNKLQDILTENGVCAENIEKYINMIWLKANFGNNQDQTKNYFATFSKLPTNTNELKDTRNAPKMKHVMTRKIIWNSLKEPFQIE